MLKWVAISFSRGSSWPRDWTSISYISCISRWVLNPPAMQETLVRIPGSERSTGERIGYLFQYSWAPLVAHLVKNLPAMQETWVQSLGWEDPLEKGKATHSSILAWRIPWPVSGPITSWKIDGETVEAVSDFIFLGSKITADGDCSHEIKRHSLEGKLWPT